MKNRNGRTSPANPCQDLTIVSRESDSRPVSFRAGKHNHVSGAAAYMQRMPKTMTQMDLQSASDFDHVRLAAEL